MRQKQLRLNFRYFLIVMNIMIFAGCAPVNRTSSRSALKSGDGSQAAPVTVNGETHLTLPSYCVMAQSSEQLCFRCERQDAGISIPYEQCLSPTDSFQASRDCAFTNESTKSISCVGTRDGAPFQMDVSLAREKISAALPAFMIALDLSARKKFPGRPDIIALTSDLSSFLGSRIQQIINGEDLERTSGDLHLLVSKHIKTPLSESQAQFFKKTALEAFILVGKDLSGRKDYDLSRFIIRGIAIAKSIPTAAQGEARPFLSGAGLAEILRDENSQTLVRSFGILNPSILGVKSAEDLISELQNAK